MKSKGKSKRNRIRKKYLSVQVLNYLQKLNYREIESETVLLQNSQSLEEMIEETLISKYR